LYCNTILIFVLIQTNLDHLDIYSIKMIVIDHSYVELIQFEIPLHQPIESGYNVHQFVIKTIINSKHTNNHFTYKMTHSNHFHTTSN